MFIQTEATPNPATLKFLPGVPVMQTGSAEFRTEEEAQQSPLAEQLFRIPGVSSVFFGYDFISVTREGSEEDGFDWQHLKPAILGTIMEHFVTGKPVMHSGVGDIDLGEEDFESVGCRDRYWLWLLNQLRVMVIEVPDFVLLSIVVKFLN